MRACKVTALLLLCALLSGCTQARQVESVAFAVILGADLTEDEGIELTVQIPKVGGGSAEAQDGSGGPSDYLIASASGATFTDALMALEITVPRDLTLTQVKLLVVSDALARHEKFLNFAESLARLDQSCASAYFAVCRGNAGDFVREQKPVIGMRVSLGLLAMFDHHKTRGYITGANFADFYYQGVSVFSDPVAILCATAQEAPGTSSGQGALDGLTPETVPASSENENEYVGAALFRDGAMVGALDGLETSLLNAVSGAPVFFNYSLEGMPVSLQSHGLSGSGGSRRERTDGCASPSTFASTSSPTSRRRRRRRCGKRCAPTCSICLRNARRWAWSRSASPSMPPCVLRPSRTGRPTAGGIASGKRNLTWMCRSL